MATKKAAKKKAGTKKKAAKKKAGKSTSTGKKKTGKKRMKRPMGGGIGRPVPGEWGW